jgi:hypothetical protein
MSQKTVQDFGADASCDVVAAFGPVQTWSNQWPGSRRGSERTEVDVEVVRNPWHGNRFWVQVRVERTNRYEKIRDTYTEPTGKMVVTSPSAPKSCNLRGTASYLGR